MEQQIEAYEQLIDRAHLAGLMAVLATLAPFSGAFEGDPLQTFFSPEKEAKRQRVNDWIRKRDRDYTVVDFDQALADPANPSRLRPEFDCGDHLHPSDAGYAAMAGHIDLSIFS